MKYSTSSIVIALLLLGCTMWTSTVSATGCGIELPADGNGVCTDQQCTQNVSNFCVMGVAKGEPCVHSHECYIDLSCQKGKCEKAPGKSKNMGVGLAAAAVATLCFGSSFVPIKKYKKFAGDGVFSQFCMCFGRFFVGLIILLTRTNQIFYPHAAMGGIFWAMGNTLSVPIIQCVGMGLGIAIWGTTNMIIGWASGAFGLWGIKKETAETPWLSYLGVFFSFCSIILFVFVEPHHKKKEPSFEDAPEEEEERVSVNGNNEKESLLPTDTYMHNPGEPASPGSPQHPAHPTLADTIGKTKARVIGVALALTAGALFGICMDPSQRLMSNYETLTLEDDVKYTPDGLDYVFSFNTGAMGMSFCTLLVYLSTRALGFRYLDAYFNPVEHEKILLPSFANGFIGSTASAAWFVANQNLGFIVSFPIIAAGPGVVSAAWGVFVFGEIKGRRNYAFLFAAFLSVIASSVCSAVGKG